MTGARRVEAERDLVQSRKVHGSRSTVPRSWATSRGAARDRRDRTPREPARGTTRQGRERKVEEPFKRWAWCPIDGWAVKEGSSDSHRFIRKPDAAASAVVDRPRAGRGYSRRDATVRIPRMRPGS